MTFDLAVAARLAIAGLAGMAVGIEREWSGHSTGPGARFAGVRTFLLLGLQGGLAGWLLDGGLTAVGVLLLAGGVALTVAAYVMAARPGGEAADGTTEMAALVVLALGTVAGLGFPLVTSAIASVMVLALAEKTRIHQAIQHIGERELGAALQFAVLALVILPLLPEGPFGPFDSIRPRSLWTVVLIFSGLNFVGYLATRAFGSKRGYTLSGLLGGLISSTAVTWQASHRSRNEPTAGRALALGVIGACTLLIVRIAVLTAFLNVRVVLPLVPYLLPVLVAGTAVFAFGYLRDRSRGSSDTTEESRNPLGLWAAIKMALAFQLVLLAVPLVRQAWGTPGVVASSAALGFTDMDALTFAMARLGKAPDAVALAARGIAVGVLSNTALKLGISLVVGRGGFRRFAVLGLAVLAAASGLGLWFGFKA